MNLFDGNTKSANPASDVFAIIFGFIWKKPQITQMLAHARAVRRCFACGKTCFAAALELPKYSLKQKATPKRLRQQLANVSERERRTRATSSSQEHIPAQVVRRVAAAEGCVCVVCVFFQMYPKTLANAHLQTPDTYLLQSFQKQHL